MKKQNHILALLLTLGAWPGASPTQAATADAVLEWGYNGYNGQGQTAVPVAAQSGVVAIAAGDYHTVALKNDHSVVAWGESGWGQTTVPVEAQSGVTAIAAGFLHTVALKNNGAVVAWGDNTYGETTIPSAAQSGVVAIAAGLAHTVALKNDQSVVAWGAIGINWGQAPPNGSVGGVKAIAAGALHTVFLNVDGSVHAVGDNTYGQITIPVAAQSGVVAIAAGHSHTVALKTNGSVVAWGILDQTTVPVAAQSGVVAIAAGAGHTVALKNDGSVVAWGDNNYGQTTVPFGAQSGVKAIAAGGLHTVALVIPTAPTITTQPMSQTVNVGQSASFTVTATGYPSYRWRFNDADIPGATMAALSLPNVTTNQTGGYSVIVSNQVGMVTSVVARLEVIEMPPVFTRQPTNQTAVIGSAVFLYAHADAVPAALYFLRRNGLELGFPPSTSGFFTLYSVTHAESGDYTFVASNYVGLATSVVARLEVIEAPPVFTQQPSSQTAMEGSTVSFNGYAVAAPAAVYFLQHNGLDVGFPPSTGGFTLHRVTLADGGDYAIVASNYVGVATSAVARLTVQRAGPLDRWTARNPNPQGNELFAVTYGQDKFVAVGDNGAIINSADGTNWNVRSSHSTSALFDVTYANGLFVVVGADGTILTSTNGDNWSRQQIISASVFRGVAYGNGQFVAVGQHGSPSYNSAFFASSNAVDWVDVTANFSTSGYLTRVAYGSNGFVVVDYVGNAYQSTDLIHWTGSTAGLSYLESVRFVNGCYVTVGNNGGIATSLNGTTWTTLTVGTKRFYDVTYGAGRYIVVGAKGNIRHSTDAASWSLAATPTSDRLQGVAYGNGLFVAVGEHGTILTSGDGQNWLKQVNDLFGLAVGHGLAIAVGLNGTILTSADGTAWTRQSASGYQDDWHGVGYGNGKWVVVGQSTNLLTSTNGVGWEVHWPGFNPSYLKSVVYANGLWVAVGAAASIITSPDAVTWTQRASPVPSDLNEVTYGNGVFVIVGDQSGTPNGKILTSTDGVNWDDRTDASTGVNARGIAFANGLFVVALNDGNILYGPDPISIAWSYAVTGVSKNGANLRGLTWSNGLWVATGNNGLLLTSTNAQVWKQRLTPTDQNLHAVRFFNGTFIAIGNAGTILQTGPLVPQLFAGRSGGNLQLTFSSPDEGVFKLQETDDFIWHDLATITNAVGTVDYTVPLPPGTTRKFFRVIVP